MILGVNDALSIDTKPIPIIKKIQIIGCIYSLSYLLNYLNFIIYFLFFYLKIILYFYSFNYWLLYNYTPYDLYFYDDGKGFGVGRQCGMRAWCQMLFYTLLRYALLLKQTQNLLLFEWLQIYQLFLWLFHRQKQRQLFWLILNEKEREYFCVL